jgi:T-complex protein 1 subunit alpha
LDLSNGKVRNSVEAGVLEPAISKTKSLQFATEAAITILRIDDMIRLNPREDPKDRMFYYKLTRTRALCLF